MVYRVVQEEVDLLARVSALLELLPEDPGPREAPILAELKRLRQMLVSPRESSDRKDRPALMDEWNRQSAILRQLQVSRQTPRVDPAAPYFAHLRLREDGQERDLCLGRATCIDGGVRIVDWRDAPISRLFYRYKQGEEFEEEIAGRVREGEVVARRLVRFSAGVLDRVQAPEGDFRADAQVPDGWRRCALERPRLGGSREPLMRRHSGRTGRERRLGSDLHGAEHRVDKRLPEIAALLDSAQFDLITERAPGPLVIRGSAGSGKTTVALHRIAYLAHDDPRIDSSESLVVLFSPALRSYVGHLLPSLGLERVRIATYADWARQLRKRHFPTLPVATRDDTPARVRRIKLHPAIGVALAAQVARVEGAATGPQALDDWVSVLTQKRLLEEVFEREAPGVVTPERLDEFVWYNRKLADDLSEWLGGDRRVQVELDAEDDALLLRAWQLRVGPLRQHGKRPLRLRHVVVDEVQDFSPLEIQVLLGCLGRDASVTLAGDTQQHIVEHSGFTSWDTFFSQVGLESSRLATLKVSYRSSQEITDFALSVLGDLREDEEPPAATRSGPPVELFHLEDRGGAMAFLVDALRALVEAEPSALVGVLAPSAASAQACHDALERAELPRLRHVRNHDFAFTPGIEVAPLEQTKGLEFDYVVLIDADVRHYPEEPSARRRLHLAATRAIHQLWLISCEVPSPLLRDLDR